MSYDANTQLARAIVAVIAIGFATPSDRADHFKKHAQDFDAASEIDYEQLAVVFLNAPRDVRIVEGTRRSNGDIIRFHKVTQEFAVMGSDGIVKTFYKPDPAWHGFRSNSHTSRNECAK